MSEGSAAPRYRMAAAWLLLIPIAIAARWLSAKGLFFLSVDPVPVRLNPPLFLISLGLGAATSTMAWFSWPRWLSTRSLWSPLIASLYALAVCGLVSSTYPGAGSIVTRETIVVDPPPPPRGTAFAIAVLFENNSNVLSASEKQRLRDNFEVYKGCQAGNLKVRGFASSAGFAQFSEYRNLRLANARANAVAAEVTSVLGVTPELQTWLTHEEMEKNKRIRDIDLTGGRILSAEARNRRAELVWDDQTCFTALPVDANLQPTALTAPPD